MLTNGGEVPLPPVVAGAHRHDVARLNVLTSSSVPNTCVLTRAIEANRLRK
jgi:hypothetical protein